MSDHLPTNPNNGGDDTHEQRPEIEAAQDGDQENPEPIEAELVSPETVDSQMLHRPAFSPVLTPTAELVMAPPNYALPAGFENLQATGGAVGALVLGVWSILGSLLTPYAAINSMLGIVLGLWGLTSQKKRLSLAGIILCVIGLGMSLFEVSRIISLFFTDDPGQ